MIYLIDNYDSFTYNIVEILKKNNFKVKIILHDKITIDELQEQASSIDGFIFSPGPGSPENSGICPSILKNFSGFKPIFGICLGHQIIAQHFGAKVSTAPRIMHGKISSLYHTGNGLFTDIPQAFKATRYHSLTVPRGSLPAELKETCWTQTDSGQPFEVMGIRHRDYPIEGVQFHPESIMTPYGENLLTQYAKNIYSSL